MPSRLVATSSKTEEAREMRTDDGTAQLVNADSGTVGKANSVRPRRVLYVVS